jgi:ElaB/YqjD/DUF883 family membrane-anchored ribosome-binding protein
MTQPIDNSMEKLIADFNAVVADSEQLLKTLAAVGGEKGAELRASAEENLRVAREQLENLQDTALERGRAAADATDAYVRSNPWQALGIVAIVAALAGLVVGVLMNRR